MIRHQLPAEVTGYVAERYLYGMDPARTGLVPARVAAVETYPGDAPTLTVLLLGDGPEGGSVFSYLPFEAFVTRPDAEALPLRSLVYHDCPEGPAALERVPGLPGRCAAWLRAERRWVGAAYLATLDWWRGNDLLNLVLLDTGQLAALPFHKLKFGEGAPAAFAPFRKMRETWRVAG